MSKISIDSADAPKKVTRKRAVKSMLSNDEETIASSARTRSVTSGQTARKAPARTTLSETNSPSSKRYLKVFAVMAVLFAVSIWVGVSDSGQIDVNARITERNNKVTSGEVNSADSQMMVVPVQNSAPSVPNAGLHGRGVGTVNVPDATQVVATTSDANIEASSSAAVGSTTVESNTEGSDGTEVVQ